MLDFEQIRATIHQENLASYQDLIVELSTCPFPADEVQQYLLIIFIEHDEDAGPIERGAYLLYEPEQEHLYHEAVYLRDASGDNRVAAHLVKVRVDLRGRKHFTPIWEYRISSNEIEKIKSAVLL